MKRIMDFLLSFLGLIILSPLLVIIAVIVKIETDGPVFFRQIRVGRYEKPFRIIKFRTMIIGPDASGPGITVAGDYRITRFGSLLRRLKLDELPQLLNVVVGEMSLVGPRPEVPEYIKYYPDDLKKKILSVPPGITDPASLHFYDEERLLAQSVDPLETYINEVLPKKLNLCAKYVDSHNLCYDIFILFQTLLACFNRSFVENDTPTAVRKSDSSIQE